MSDLVLLIAIVKKGDEQKIEMPIDSVHSIAPTSINELLHEDAIEWTVKPSFCVVRDAWKRSHE